MNIKLKLKVILLLATIVINHGTPINLNYADPLQDKMVGLWSTPILKRTLISEDSAHNGQLNNDIKKNILKGFNNFKSTSLSNGQWKGSGPNISFVDGHSLNDLFFAHQHEFWSKNDGALWPPLQTPVVQSLLGAIRELVSRYLGAADPVGQAKAKEENDNKAEKQAMKIFMWAGVHSGCVCHLQHIHAESAVSGTYYVSAPKGSGALVLTDPRGLLPPFGGRHIHQPKAGEVILFPSWLRHEVAPSCDVTEKNPRVALSFNVVGDWSMTNDATYIFFDLMSSATTTKEKKMKEEEKSKDELEEEEGGGREGRREL